MPDHPLAGWLRLTLTPGVGLETQRKLLSAFGLPERIYAASGSAVAAAVGDRAARALAQGPDETRVQTAIDWSEQPGNHILTLADASYPARLLECADPPTLLYAKGCLALLGRPAVAVVGARNPTGQGEANAEQFARALARAGLTVVSGLALGCDSAAHAGALDATGSTIAVIGTGADRIYPARNAALARAIAADGLILSEFALGTPALKENFPRRNRIISGLSLGVVVIEAALRSGTLITARLAGEQGREVFALPGSIHSPLSKGCHQLIKQGAKLVDDARDILCELRIPPPPLTATDSTPAAGADALADDTAKLLGAMGFDPVTLDVLLLRSNLTADHLSAMLLTLELSGQVATLPGGRFQRLK